MTQRITHWIDGLPFGGTSDLSTRTKVFFSRTTRRSSWSHR